MGSEYLWELSQEFFELAEAALDPQRTGQDLPGKRLIHHNQPVVEFCETGTLAVWHGPIEFQQFGLRDAPQLLNVSTFNIEVWRCWPAGNVNPPSVEALEDATRAVNIDGWCLLTGVQAGIDRITSCESVTFQTMRVMGPLGGMAGWKLSLTVGLSGRVPPLV